MPLIHFFVADLAKKFLVEMVHFLNSGVLLLQVFTDKINVLSFVLDLLVCLLILDRGVLLLVYFFLDNSSDLVIANLLVIQDGLGLWVICIGFVNDFHLRSLVPLSGDIELLQEQAGVDLHSVDLFRND